jgi:hypothetical protein
MTKLYTAIYIGNCEPTSLSPSSCLSVFCGVLHSIMQEVRVEDMEDTDPIFLLSHYHHAMLLFFITAKIMILTLL